MSVVSDQWSGSPARIRGAVAGSVLRGAVDVVDAGLGLIGAHQRIVLYGDPIRLTGDRVFGNDSYVAGGDQLLQRLRRLLLIHGVLVNAVAQSEQILLENAFASVVHGHLVIAHGDT